MSRSYPTLFAARLGEGHGTAEAWLGAASFFTCTDCVVAQEASDVASSSRLDFLGLHNLRRRFIA